MATVSLFVFGPTGELALFRRRSSGEEAGEIITEESNYADLDEVARRAGADLSLPALLQAPRRLPPLDGAPLSRGGSAAYVCVLSWAALDTLDRRRAGRDPSDGKWQLDRTIAFPELLDALILGSARLGTRIQAVLADGVVLGAIRAFGEDLIRGARHVVLDVLTRAKGGKPSHMSEDAFLASSLLPKPDDLATELDSSAVFLDGRATSSGAYRVGEMLDRFGGMPDWQVKLADPYERYVAEELDVLKQTPAGRAIAARLAAIDVDGCAAFVRAVLHYPLESGQAFRMDLSNLDELAAGREALNLYLKVDTNLPSELILNPLRDFNWRCNEAVQRAWQDYAGEFRATSESNLARMLRLNALLNALDFHTPVHRGAFSTDDGIAELVRDAFEASAQAPFCDELGGDGFVGEFLRACADGDAARPRRLVYFTDNNGQLVVSLKCIEWLLRREPHLFVTLVPKCGQYANDASFDDVENLLRVGQDRGEPLSRFITKGRLTVLPDGPRMQGVDPQRMSSRVCSVIRTADLVFAEGQACAEVKGWLRPTYLLFKVKGRVAEAIHGVSRHVGAIAFVKVGSGAHHYGPARSPNADEAGADGESALRVWEQTTADYVRAVRSENYALLLEYLFGGNEELMVRRLQSETRRLGKPLSEVVCGAEPPSVAELEHIRERCRPDVFAIGGGGGFNQVTLRALAMLPDVRTVAGVPSTDDGGSSGKLQRLLAPHYGFIFGVGDAGGVLEQQVSCRAKQAILSYRSPGNATSFQRLLLERIVLEVRHPTFPGERLEETPDFYSFVCNQLNMARVVDAAFVTLPGFELRGASVRNLDILAAFQLTGALSGDAGDETKAERAWWYLQRALGIPLDQYVVPQPVTYREASLWGRYPDAIPDSEITRLHIPSTALSENRQSVLGQQYVDQIVVPKGIVEFAASSKLEEPAPRTLEPAHAYLRAIREARLFVMGAGSLFGSQLAQLAVPGVVDALVARTSMRKVLIVNHVLMNETAGYTLADHVRAVESLARRVAGGETTANLRRPIRFGDLFTDVVVPRTVAREIDDAMNRSGVRRKALTSRSIRFVTPRGEPSTKDDGILRNHYVDYVLEHPEFRVSEKVTNWELRILSYLDQPLDLYKERSEAGRYRGAVYARESDIQYLVEAGIARRNIYEVECVAMNRKILKAEGDAKEEEFPGLIAEALVGIFKIFLENSGEARARD